MEILITHLTRMRGQRVCVAGLTEDGQHVRPVPRVGTLSRADALVDFQLGNVVRLAAPRHVPGNGAPEDWEVDLEGCLAVRTAPDEEIHERLEAVAFDSLAGGFPGVQARANSRWVVPGEPDRSLAVVRARAWRLVPRFWQDQQSVILGFHDPALPAVQMPVTDLRLFPVVDDGVGFSELMDLSSFLDPRRRLLACVGLTRPFGPDGATPVRWTTANTLWPDRSTAVSFPRTSS